MTSANAAQNFGQALINAFTRKAGTVAALARLSDQSGISNSLAHFTRYCTHHPNRHRDSNAFRGVQNPFA